MNNERRSKMQTPIACANYIIDLANKNNYEVTNFKLNKILFFMQGYFLNKYHKPLMSGEFLKFQQGPIEKNVYNNLRSYGAETISKPIVSYAGFINNQFKVDIKVMPDIGNMSIFVIRLLQIPAYKLADMTKSDPSYQNYKKQIMSNSAPTYTNKEILYCFRSCNLFICYDMS